MRAAWRALGLTVLLGAGLAEPVWALSAATEVGWRVDASGAAQTRSLTLVTEVPPSDRGQSAQHFVAAEVQGQLYCHDGSTWAVCGATLPHYTQGPLPARLSLSLGTVDSAALRGVRVWAGYGSSAEEMLASGRYRQVYTLGRASGIQWDAATTVTASAELYLAFNNTAVALRDATAALHLVWDAGGRGYHGRHDSSAWHTQVLPQATRGRVSKVSLAALSDGELIAAWSEDERSQRSVVVARTEDGRSRWAAPLVLGSGGLDAPVALHAFERGDGRTGATVVWMDSTHNRLQARAWSGADWSTAHWSAAVSPAAGSAQPHDVTLAGSQDQVWAFWEDRRAGGPTEIYMSRSEDGGEHWQTDQRLPLLGGSATGGDPSAVWMGDGTLLVAWQAQNKVQYVRSRAGDGSAWDAPVVLGPGLFPHVAADPRGQVAFTWEHFSGGGAFDDSTKTAGNSLSLDDLATLAGPHAMPGSDAALFAVQAAVCTAHDRIDVFWIDASTTGLRQLKWRSGRYLD